MNFIKRLSKSREKITFYFDFGRGPGQRPSTGIFIYTKPKNQTEKNHNKDALSLLEIKKSQLIIESQAIGTSFIPSHKFKSNFLEYYEEYVQLNKRKANRHLINSFRQFKLFVGRDFISSTEITENFCKRFRQFLLDKFSGETPAGYYALSHGGDDAGAHSICFLLPQTKEGIIIFTNSDNGVNLYADILKAYLKENGQTIINIEMK